METQGRLTRVTVETQVSGNIPFWILTWDDCQIYPSTSSLWIQVVPTDQVGEAGREETEVKDQVEEETEVKSEDQTANVSQPDQKVMQVNPAATILVLFFLPFPEHMKCFHMKTLKPLFDRSFFDSQYQLLESETCFQCVFLPDYLHVFNFRETLTKKCSNNSSNSINLITTFPTNLHRRKSNCWLFLCKDILP